MRLDELTKWHSYWSELHFRQTKWLCPLSKRNSEHHLELLHWTTSNRHGWSAELHRFSASVVAASPSVTADTIYSCTRVLDSHWSDCILCILSELVDCDVLRSLSSHPLCGSRTMWGEKVNEKNKLRINFMRNLFISATFSLQYKC